MSSKEKKLIRFYYKKSRIQQLKGFCYTAQLKSVSKAAKKMGLGVSTVSMQIKALEDDLKIKLFKRDHKNGISLTKRGQDLYDISVKYVYSIDNIFEKFLFVKDIRYQNKLNIAGDSMILSHLLPHYLYRFSKKYPTVELLFHNISKEECKRQILDKQIDVGIYVFAPEEKISVEFKNVKHKDYETLLIMPKSHPLADKADKSITEQDLAGAGDFAYIPELATETLKRFIERYKVQNHLKIENANVEILKEMVAEGMCVSFIPEIYLCKNKNLVAKNANIDFGYKGSYYGMISRIDNDKEMLEVFVEGLREKNA